MNVEERSSWYDRSGLEVWALVLQLRSPPPFASWIQYARCRQDARHQYACETQHASWIYCAARSFDLVLLFAAYWPSDVVINKVRLPQGIYHSIKLLFTFLTLHTAIAWQSTTWAKPSVQVWKDIVAFSTIFSNSDVSNFKLLQAPSSTSRLMGQTTIILFSSSSNPSSLQVMCGKKTGLLDRWG